MGVSETKSPDIPMISRKQIHINKSGGIANIYRAKKRPIIETATICLFYKGHAIRRFFDLRKLGVVRLAVHFTGQRAANVHGNRVTIISPAMADGILKPDITGTVVNACARRILEQQIIRSHMRLHIRQS